MTPTEVFTEVFLISMGRFRRSVMLMVMACQELQLLARSSIQLRSRRPKAPLIPSLTLRHDLAVVTKRDSGPSVFSSLFFWGEKTEILRPW